MEAAVWVARTLLVLEDRRCPVVLGGSHVLVHGMDTSGQPTWVYASDLVRIVRLP